MTRRRSALAQALARHLALQSALSDAQPDVPILGRQHRARTLRGRSCPAVHADILPLGRNVPRPCALRMAISRPGLAGDPQEPAGAAAARLYRLRLQQRAVLLGPAAHPGLERAADPVVGAAVRRALVADAVRREAVMDAGCRHPRLVARRARHRPCAGISPRWRRSRSTPATSVSPPHCSCSVCTPP